MYNKDHTIVASVAAVEAVHNDTICDALFCPMPQVPLQRPSVWKCWLLLFQKLFPGLILLVQCSVLYSLNLQI